jgi:RNA polymerase sigma-70 factor (ECF subfamily)
MGRRPREGSRQVRRHAVPITHADRYERMTTATQVRIESDEETLVDRARGGDQRSFEALYRTHAGRVFGICMRMANDRDEAETWAQDAWVRAWERLDTFRGESAFPSWLHRVTVNLILDRKRRDARRMNGLKRIARDARPSSVPPDRGGELRLDLSRAVATLPEGARTVFLLHDVEGYKHREIADRLGVAVGTVKAQLHRARRLLREALQR